MYLLMVLVRCSPAWPVRRAHQRFMSPMPQKYRPLLIVAVVLLCCRSRSSARPDVDDRDRRGDLRHACMGLNILGRPYRAGVRRHGAFFGLAGYAAALSQRHCPDGIIFGAVAIGSACCSPFSPVFSFCAGRGVYFSLFDARALGDLFAVAFRWTA